ncbi:hypothetical protein BDW71DRAFT_209636 [Aspergillus fruticulosus]
MSSQNRPQELRTKPQPLQLSGLRRSSALKYEMSPLTRKQTLEETTFKSQQAPSPGLLTRSSAVKYDRNVLTRLWTLEQEPEPSSLGLRRSSAVKYSFNPLTRRQTQTRLDDTREYSSSPTDSTMSTSWDTSRSRSDATSTRTRDTSLSPSLESQNDPKLPDTLDGLADTGKPCAINGQYIAQGHVAAAVTSGKGRLVNVGRHSGHDQPSPPRSVYGKIRHVDDEYD